jgi:four helix bundle protein
MKLIRDAGSDDSIEQTAAEPPIGADGFDGYDGGVGAFPHEKLDAYRVALAMARGANALAQRIPRGHRSVADHLLRSSSNAVLLLAEGANRRGPAEKRQRFVESRGEVGEVAAACDLVMVLEVDAEAGAAAVKRDAARVGAMLTRLIHRLT